MSAPDRLSYAHGKASDFYMACRTGDTMTVDRYLKTYSVREINHVEESNGSTALHAACYHGHADVVEHLLRAGASLHTKNGFGLTPDQEAQDARVREVIQKHQNSQK